MDLVETKSLDLVGRVEDETNLIKKESFILDYIREAEESSPWFSLTKAFDIFGGSEWINCNRKLEFSDFSGKLVLLDFFTYCCINCIHIMPFLHKLESKLSMKNNLIIIGVHSAKFPNEKVEANIKNAVARYNLQHPVMNDSKIKVWEEFSVKCWPTLVLISPSKKVLFSIPGESHTEFIELFIDMAKEFYETKKELDKKPVTFSLVDGSSTADNVLDGISKLCFPGKVAIDALGERIAISDSGNHRVIVSDLLGNVQRVIGGSAAGYADGDFGKAMFDSPQGVTWCGKNSIFVADCNNHAVRKIDLLVKKVVTLCGTGLQGNDFNGGRHGLEQPISSPWDLVVAGSPRFANGKSILYIAMSGYHQIWAFFLKTTDYQKGAEIEMGTCIRYAGNGNEENRNNSYPHKAGFAQPSGLAIDEEGHAMYVADSESSTVRKINLSNGAVQALVGGDIDPMNLFSFGDVDGKGRDAKLQHPIGVSWDRKRNMLYVADTYNHKIKIVDTKKKTCQTIESLEDPNGESEFNEPSGLAMDPSCENLYVADTNNHSIKVIALKDYSVTSLTLTFKSYFDSISLEETDGPKGKLTRPITRKNTAAKSLNRLVLRGPQDVVLMLSYPSYALNPDAPSMWQITCFDENHNADESLIHVASGRFEADVGTTIALKSSQLLHVLKTSKCQDKLAEVMATTLCVEGVLYYCVKESGVCKMHNYKAILPVEVSAPSDFGESSVMPAELVIEIV